MRTYQSLTTGKAARCRLGLTFAVALAHLHAKIIGAGRSPIAAAAYRHRTEMEDVAQGKTVSYAEAGADLAHEELALPAETPEWLRGALDGRSVAQGSEALWSAVYKAETRLDAQFARDLDIALPKELTLSEQIALMREFVAQHFTSRGMVADWVIHAPEGNPHVHLMHTLRPLTAEGFGSKMIAVRDANGDPVRMPNGKIVYRKFIGGERVELKGMRETWEQVANRHLALAGHDVRIDMRSYAEQGVDISPTTHIGPEALAVSQKPRELERVAEHQESRRRAAKDIERNPAAIIVQLSREQSTFTDRDIARALNRYIDDPAEFTRALDAIRANPELVRLRDDVRDPETNAIVAPAIYATRELVRVEHQMAAAADAMTERGGFGVRPETVRAMVRAVETKNPDPKKHFKFDAEQVAAIEHITADTAITAVVGFAGAGKSTLLEAANKAWTTEGRRVFGAALAGKAAEGLEESAGIASRTLASWRFSWEQGRDLLKTGDVFVVDEAGMVSSRELATIIEAVNKAGAKLVLVGDAMQLQPIEAGAAFRAITDRIGFAELVGIRRQSDAWAQQASRQFARGKVAEALTAYNGRGHVRQVDDREAAVKAIISDWAEARQRILAECAATGKPVRGDELLVLAATNKDVYALNQGIRSGLAEQGALSDARTIQTERGAREFAIGDRMIFLKNQKFEEPAAPELGTQQVKNGMLGTVVSIATGVMRVRLDSGREVAFRSTTYRNVDHGYATTVHKAQGVTVDRVFVMGTSTFDQHLSYVAMSRHRHQVTLYAPKTDFPTFEKMTATLGRSGAKTTTLDFENETDYRAAAAPFMARRGIDTIADIAPAFAAFVDRQRAWISDQAKTVADLWQRAEAALGIAKARAAEQHMPSAAPVPVSPPQPAPSALVALPALPAATSFARSVRDDAGSALLRGVIARRAEDLMTPDLNTTFANPPAAFAEIAATLAKNSNPADLVAAVVDTPERFGQVLDTAAAAKLAPHVRALAVAYARDLPNALKVEEQRRAAMATAIPALSPKALDTLSAIESARQAAGDRGAREALRLGFADKTVSAELKAASDALSARFGWQSFGPKETPADRTRAAARVPDEIAEAFDAARPTLAAIRAFGDQLHYAEKRAADRAEAQPVPTAERMPEPDVVPSSPRRSASVPRPIDNEIGTKPMDAVTMTIEGNVARVAFAYDDIANTQFKAAIGNIPAKHQDGAWTINLPADDQKFRDNVVAKIEAAAKAIGPCLQEVKEGADRAKELSATLPKFDNVQVTERHGTLAVRIPPVQDAIDELKALRATWVPKMGDTGGYWKLPVPGEKTAIDPSFAETVAKALTTANAAIAEQSKSPTLAADITSPHEEIQLATRGDKLYVTTPQMAETHAILKAQGPGAMHWDAKTKAFTVTVTADNAGDVAKRLDTVGASYELAVVPPHHGRPGVLLDQKNRDQFERVEIAQGKGAQVYALDPAFRRAIDNQVKAFEVALTSTEKAALLKPETPTTRVSGLERIAAMGEKRQLASQSLTQATTIQREGQKLLQAQQQAQAQDKGVAR